MGRGRAGGRGSALSGAVLSLEALEARVVGAFETRFGEAPEVLAWAPGRVNLIGEHTDYTGGLAMPAAVDRYVVAALSRADRVELVSLDYDDVLCFEAGAAPEQASGWRAYAAGAYALSAERAGSGLGGLGGCRGVVAGDVPLGAGLSSSAAIECCLLNGFRELFELEYSDIELIRLAQRIEHERLGLQSGLLDQFASQMSRAGTVMIVDFRTLSALHVPADLSEHRWLVADTGVRRELAASAYTDRVRSCAEGLAALKAAGRAEHSRDATLADVAEVGAGQPWASRLRHVLTENARVGELAAALAARDWTAAGAALHASHASLRDDYQVSCAELDALAELAEAYPGCLGARMMGGGFGGCTIQLVERDRVEGFRAALSAGFEARFGRGAPVWSFDLVDGAGVRRVG